MQQSHSLLFELQLLYFAYDLEANANSTHIKTVLGQAFRFSEWRSCFDSIKFLSAKLDPADDSYGGKPSGAGAGACHYNFRIHINKSIKLSHNLKVLS